MNIDIHIAQAILSTIILYTQTIELLIFVNLYILYIESKGFTRSLIFLFVIKINK